MSTFIDYDPEDWPEPPVLGVVVAEGGQQAGVADGQAKALRLFREVALPVIHVEQVGDIIVADVNVEIAIAIDIDDGGPGRPDVLGRQGIKLRAGHKSD